MKIDGYISHKVHVKHFTESTAVTESWHVISNGGLYSTSIYIEVRGDWEEA